MTFKKGDRVTWNAAACAELALGSTDHFIEFRNRIGEVQGLTDYGTQQGPELDVRWWDQREEKFFLRYAYRPDQLQLVD